MHAAIAAGRWLLGASHGRCYLDLVTERSQLASQAMVAPVRSPRFLPRLPGSLSPGAADQHDAEQCEGRTTELAEDVMGVKGQRRQPRTSTHIASDEQHSTDDGEDPTHSDLGCTMS